jgi:uncharacterized protein with GYD domain
MPKYLFRATYTAEGMKGLISEGGTGRRALIKHLTQELGGELETFYYAFGESDVYAIVDFPDGITAAAVTLAINQTGAVHVKTTVLLTPEEVDEAAQMTVRYRRPGGTG